MTDSNLFTPSDARMAITTAKRLLLVLDGVVPPIVAEPLKRIDGQLEMVLAGVDAWEIQSEQTEGAMHGGSDASKRCG